MVVFMNSALNTEVGSLNRIECWDFGSIQFYSELNSIWELFRSARIDVTEVWNRSLTYFLNTFLYKRTIWYLRIGLLATYSPQRTCKAQIKGVSALLAPDRTLFDIIVKHWGPLWGGRKLFRISECSWIVAKWTWIELNTNRWACDIQFRNWIPFLKIIQLYSPYSSVSLISG